MIKINLGSRKQPNYATGESGSKTLLGRVSLSKADFEDIPLRKIILAAIACVLANVLLEDFKQEKINEIDEKIRAGQKKLVLIQKEVEKTKGFEKVQKQLDEDELLIKNKIETIQKLISNRRRTAEMLLSLSETIPEEVWLKGFRSQSGLVQIQGRSRDYNFVSDFMRKLGESSYYQDLSLDATSQLIVNGVQIAEFGLKAKVKE